MVAAVASGMASTPVNAVNKISSVNSKEARETRRARYGVVIDLSVGGDSYVIALLGFNIV